MGHTPKPNRRDFMKTSAGAMTVGLVGIAGCAGDGGDEGGETTTESGGETTPTGEDMGEKVREVELIVTTSDYDPVRYEFGQMAAENWRELGIDVNVNPMAWNQLLNTALVGQNFDTYTLNWAGRAERIDPNHFCYSVFHSSQQEEGQYNFVHYTNEEYDKYAEKQQQTYDKDERQEAVYKCQEIAMGDQPHTPIAHKEQVMPYNSDRFSNVKAMMGEGLMTFWNMVDIEPAEGVTTFKLGYPSDINSPNPLNVQATHDAQTLRLVYDRLMRIGLDGLPKNWMAESMEQEDDTTFLVTLRDGMKFHDGEDVTAEDVRFTFDYIEEHSPKLSQRAEPIESTEMVDDMTVRFNLTEPYAPFIANTLGTVYILPQHIWKDVPDNVDAEKATNYPNQDAIGSGPFKFTNWRQGEELRMEANTEHFHAPNIDTLLKIPGASMQTLTRQMEAGEIDAIGWVPQPSVQDRLNQQQHLALARKPSHGYYHINYKTDKAPFDDVSFRRALAYGIPKNDIVETLLQGRGQVAQTQLAPVNEFWHNPDTEKFNLNLDKARTELENAGYTWDENGKLHHPK